MAHNSRRDDILQIVARLRSVTVGELTERTGVSEVTIRKDLKLLEEMGAIVRTHGGAALAEDRDRIRTLRSRSDDKKAEKNLIAERAASFVSEGDTIFIDSGTTCSTLAGLVAEMNIRVVTNSLPVMQTLSASTDSVLLSVGGSYRAEAGSFLGPAAIRSIRDLRIETCFVGATGVALDGVFSSQNLLESEVKREALAVSKRRVVLADATKIGAVAFAVFAGPDDVDVLITDEMATEHAETLMETGIEVIIAVGSTKN